MKTTVLTAALVAGFATMAQAQYSGPSDVATPENGKYTSMTVQQILAEPKDDTDVQLEGRLIRKLKNETYMFSDGTGEIQVEIDDDDFPMGDVNENTTIRLQGEVDVHRSRPVDIDVDRASVVQ